MKETKSRALVPPSQNDESAQESAGIIEPEVLDKVPDEVKKDIIRMSSFMGSFSGPVHPPFMKKINEEHISKILDLSENESKRDFEDAQSTKKYNLAYVLVSCALFVFVVVYLGDKNPDLLKEILKYLAAVAGGAGGALAWKARKNKKEED